MAGNLSAPAKNFPKRARANAASPGGCRAGAGPPARKPSSRPCAWALRSARDALDFVEREALTADRQDRRILREVDRIDDALDFGRHRDRLAAGVLGSDRHL